MSLVTADLGSPPDALYGLSTIAGIAGRDSRACSYAVRFCSSARTGAISYSTSRSGGERPR
jgi:hypothetical protein